MRLIYLRAWVGTTVIVMAQVAGAAELLVSNYFGNSVTRYDTGSKAFLGSYTGGSLVGVLGTRVGSDGNLYVCSESNNTVQRFNMTTHAYTDTIISGPTLSAPTAVTFDSTGNILIGNFNNSTVTKYTSAGTSLGTLVSSGSGGLNGPDVGTVVGPDGKLYVPSFNSNAVLRYNATTGAFIDTFIAAGVGGMSQPRTILWRDNKIWITSDNGNKVLRYNLDGTFIDTFVTSGSGGLSGATGMVFGDDGLLYVSSWRNNRVVRFNATTGAFVDLFTTTGLNGPTYLTIVPEPANLLAIGLGLVGVSRIGKRRAAKT